MVMQKVCILIAVLMVAGFEVSEVASWGVPVGPCTGIGCSLSRGYGADYIGTGVWPRFTGYGLHGARGAFLGRRRREAFDEDEFNF